MACKLEIHARNILHHHILLHFEGDVIEVVKKTDQIIFAAMSTGERSHDSRGLGKKFDIYYDSPYCRGRARKEQCQIDYGTNEASPTTATDGMCHRFA